MAYETLEGSVVHFGPREPEKVRVAEINEPVRYLKFRVFSDGAGIKTEPFYGDSHETVIPANSFIKSAHMYIKEAFVRTSTATGINIGLQQADGGGVLDADGLFDGSDETVYANLDAANWWIEGQGSAINVVEAVSPVTEDAYVRAVATGTDDFTAGDAVVVVAYIPPLSV